MALLLFAVAELAAAGVLTRVILPGLAGGSMSESLTALRDEIAFFIYGATFVSALFTAVVIGGWSRRANRRAASGLLTCLSGVIGALGIAIGVAVLSQQPVVPSTTLMHVFVAVMGIFAGTAVTRLPGGSRRLRLVPLVTVVLVASSLLAPPTLSRAASDIAPADCRVETWSGSLSGGVTAFSIDVGGKFEFAAGRNINGTWDLETAASLKAGIKIQVGRKLDGLGVDLVTESAAGLAGALSAANLSLMIANHGLITISHRYSFGSEKELVRVLVGSLATFAWHAEALPGLAAFLGDMPTLPPEYQPPDPVETDYDVGTESTVSVDIGPFTFDGTLASGFRARFNAAQAAAGGQPAQPASVDLGFPTSAALAGSMAAELLPDTKASTGRDTSGELYTYLTFNRTNDLTFDGTTLEALSVSASGKVWSPSETEGLGTSVISGMGNEPGLAGAIADITDRLGPLVAHDLSANLEASLSNVSDPDVLSAILTVVLVNVQFIDGPAYADMTATYPELRQLTSRTEVVGALQALIRHSEAKIFIRSSSSIVLGLDVGVGDGVAFGFKVDGSVGHEGLVSAAIIDEAGYRASKSCTASRGGP